MNVEKLINKLMVLPLDAEVYMEGCPGQEFSLGMGSFSCDGEDDMFPVTKVENEVAMVVILKRSK